jgi:DNA-binding CsgD family transcriptional regulator
MTIKPLSEHEREVLSRISHGQSTKRIAVELWISKRTVDEYRTRIFRKLHASNAPHAVHIGHQEGIL